MTHEQMRFHLAHGIEHDADNDQQTRSAKEIGDILRNGHGIAQDNGDDGNDRQEYRASQRNAAHGAMKKIAGGLSRTHARNVTA